MCREVYNRHAHDDCMFYHNFETRLEHLSSSNKVKLSYDQHMAHEIICEWTQRAISDKSVSNIEDDKTRKHWVGHKIHELHDSYTRSLGLNLSTALQAFADLGYPQDDEAAALSICAPIEEEATEEERNQMRRLWKKNMNFDVEKRKLKMQKQIQEKIPD